MMFAKQFEVIIRYANGAIATIGAFQTYGEAYDAAILEAAKELPNETVMGFMINESYINKALPGE